MAHTFTHLTVHTIFSTKNRVAFIDDDLRQRLHPYIGGIVRELGGEPITIGGAADHVHLLATLPASISVSDAMRTIKTNSSRWVHTEMKKRTFAWQIGYAAFSVSRSNIAPVSRYIREQAEHHRRRSFKDEFLALLKKHGIEYDERYIWE